MVFFRRSMFCLLGWSVALVVATAPALAELAPSAVGQIVAKKTASGHKHHKKSHAKKHRSLFNLSLNAEKSYALGGDQLMPPGVVNDNQILLGGKLEANLTPKLRAFVSRSNHFSIAGRRYKKGKPSYSGAGWDLEYDAGLEYAVSKDLSVGEAYVYRYRVCCPNAGDPTNTKPRVKQGLRSEVTYLAGPNTVAGKPLRLHAEATYVDHHADLGLGLPGGTPVLGHVWVTKISAYLSLPFFGKQFVPFVGGEHFTDIFNNQLVPSTTNRSEYGFRLKGTKIVSYRAYVKNDHQTNPAGDVSHKVTLYLETTFKFHP